MVLLDVCTIFVNVHNIFVRTFYVHACVCVYVHIYILLVFNSKSMHKKWVKYTHSWLVNKLNRWFLTVVYFDVCACCIFPCPDEDLCSSLYVMSCLTILVCRASELGFLKI